MARRHHTRVPSWTWLGPVLASLLLALKFLGVLTLGAGLGVAAAILLASAVFAAVHHAEVVALRIGKPFGSILLAVAVTVIEVALIVSIMLDPAPGGEMVARDTVFSAVMIVLNGIVGLCLVLGGTRYGEQSFQLQGASAALSVLGALAVLAMILPNFTVAAPGPYYAPVQLALVAAVSLALYVIFVFVQTVRHRDYFLDLVPQGGAGPQGGSPHAPPAAGITAVSVLLLLVSLVAVVLLAKVLSHPLDDAVAAAGLPHAVVGVAIAAVVLLPEGLASVRAAISNRLQNSLNLALGSAIASIGLTIPVVAAASLLTGRRLALGLAPPGQVLLALTLFLGTVTLGTGRTTVLQGAVHLVIFAVFLLESAVP